MIRTRNRARGGSGGGIPFIPTDIGADLMAWYDFTDAATITGSPSVTAVLDKSTNARNLTGTGNPQWDGTKIAFNGTTNYLSRTDAFMYANGGCAVYMVVSAASSNAQAILAEGSSVNANPIYVPAYTDNSPTAGSISPWVRNDANVTNFVNTQEFGSSFLDGTINLIRIVDTGVDFTAYLNGTPSPTVRTYTRSDPLTANRFCIGGLLRSTFSVGWAGDMYEIIIAKNDVYGFEMEGYLANKYGI